MWKDILGYTALPNTFVHFSSCMVY